MKATSTLRGLTLLLLLAGCQSSEKIELQVRNDMKFDLAVVFEPQFKGSKPRLENVRSLDLPPGATKPVELERGLWRIRVDGDGELQHEKEIKFTRGGKISIDKWIIRYQPSRTTPAP